MWGRPTKVNEERLLMLLALTSGSGVQGVIFGNDYTKTQGRRLQTMQLMNSRYICSRFPRSIMLEHGPYSSDFLAEDFIYTARAQLECRPMQGPYASQTTSFEINEILCTQVSLTQHIF